VRNGDVKQPRNQITEAPLPSTVLNVCSLTKYSWIRAFRSLNTRIRYMSHGYVASVPWTFAWNNHSVNYVTPH